MIIFKISYVYINDKIEGKYFSYYKRKTSPPPKKEYSSRIYILCFDKKSKKNIKKVSRPVDPSNTHFIIKNIKKNGQNILTVAHFSICHRRHRRSWL